jgi:hypothetical protein
VSAVAFRLVTSAVVATRTPRVTLADGTGVLLAASVAGVTSAASLTTDYTFAVGGLPWAGASGAVASGPLFDVIADAGDVLGITVAAIDVGDQISRVRVTLLQQPIRDDT